MKVSVSQSILAQALSAVSHAVSTRSPLTILENILITTEDGQLCLSATNLELGIRYWLPAQIEEEGAITVPSKIFTDLVNQLQNDTVTMTLNAQTQTLSVRCNQLVTDIKGIDAADFPPMPVFDENEAVAFEMPELRKMIQQVSFAASTDDSRPIFNGVYMHVEDNQMVMVATDGFRIAVKKVVLKENFTTPITAIIPARTLNELVRITSDSDKELLMALSLGQNQVIFHLPNIELASQLISGDFVDYNAIIPKSFQTTTVVSTATLLKACGQALIIARENKNLARLSIVANQNGSGKIEITAQSDQAGTSENNIEANIDGNDLQIAFNVRFLKDGLEAISAANVAIQTNTSVSPGMITPMDDDDDYKYVIMPMHFG